MWKEPARKAGHSKGFQEKQSKDDYAILFFCLMGLYHCNFLSSLPKYIPFIYFNRISTYFSPIFPSPLSHTTHLPIQPSTLTFLPPLFPTNSLIHLAYLLQLLGYLIDLKTPFPHRRTLMAGCKWTRDECGDALPVLKSGA